MATFTWNAGTNGIWSDASNWAPRPLASLRRDRHSTQTDIATLTDTSSGRSGIYDVVVIAGQTFDLATLQIGASGHDAPALFIGTFGTLATDSLTYTGNAASGHHCRSPRCIQYPDRHQ